MAGRVVVGTTECAVEYVAKNLRGCALYHLLTEKWSYIASDLNLPDYHIAIYRGQLTRKIIRLNDLINEILFSWVEKKVEEESEARLDELLYVLTSNGMKSLAGELEFKLSNQPGQSQQGENNKSTTLPDSALAIPESTGGNSSSQSTDLTHVGSKISYFSDKILGEGFMGSKVFKGKFEERNVAVKRIHESYFSFSEREVNLLSITDENLNVIRMYCSEIKDDFRYIALELCNATLKDWMEKTESGLQVQEITDLEIFTQCVSGLMFIHEKKVVHRDIKPSNILLVKRNARMVLVKISDFGMGKQIEGSGMSVSTSGVVGSLGWIAPELWTAKKGDKIIHYPTIDIFSLGCIFSYVLTKGHPFGDDDSPSRRQLNIEDGRVKISRETPYDTRGMTNLIKLVISSLPNRRPSLSLVKNHPVFWSAQKILRLTNKVNALRPSTDFFVLQAFKDLELLGTDNGLVIKKSGKWTKTVFDKIGIDCESKPYNLKNTVTDLNRAFRNFYEHKNENNKPDVIKNASEEGYVNLWLELFPQLLTCIWIVFKKVYDNGVQEFAEFYEDATDPIWSRTERFKLINNDLEVTETSTGLTVSFGHNGSGTSTLPGPTTSSN